MKERGDRSRASRSRMGDGDGGEQSRGRGDGDWCQMVIAGAGPRSHRVFGRHSRAGTHENAHHAHLAHTSASNPPLLYVPVQYHPHSHCSSLLAGPSAAHVATDLSHLQVSRAWSLLLGPARELALPTLLSPLLNAAHASPVIVTGIALRGHDPVIARIVIVCTSLTTSRNGSRHAVQSGGLDHQTVARVFLRPSCGRRCLWHS